MNEQTQRLISERREELEMAYEVRLNHGAENEKQYPYRLVSWFRDAEGTQSSKRILYRATRAEAEAERTKIIDAEIDSFRSTLVGIEVE